MNKIRFTLKAFAFLAFTLAIGTAAQAQATRTWVSGVGDDANPCSRTAPCKTFAGAISKTADKGEIDCIDPGGFGTITITKNITIDGGGTFASILAAGTNGVVVNDSATATPGTIVVAIRNISINGAGTGINGIRFISGKTLSVEDCEISGFTTHGIDVAFGATPAVTSQLSVRNTIIRNVTQDGIRATTAAAGQVANVALERVSMVKNGNGLHLLTGGRAVVSGSFFTFHTGTGVTMESGSEAVLDGNIITSNVNGVSVNASTARLSNNTIMRNTGSGVLFTAGGVATSFGDNKVLDNGTNLNGGAFSPQGKS